MAKEKLPIVRCTRLYGVAELAAAVRQRSNNISVWNTERPRRNGLPAPTFQLACSPIWIDSAEVENWIANFLVNGPQRRARGSLAS